MSMKAFDNGVTAVLDKSGLQRLYVMHRINPTNSFYAIARAAQSSVTIPPNPFPSMVSELRVTAPITASSSASQSCPSLAYTVPRHPTPHASCPLPQALPARPSQSSLVSLPSDA